MSTFDIRDSAVEPIKHIVFSDTVNLRGLPIASSLSRNATIHDRVELRDADYDGFGEGYVVIENKEHAQMLKLALDKAIELGWLV